MNQQSLRIEPSSLVVGSGLLLFLVALVHHTREVATIGTLLGPAVALLIDGTPALVLAYLGHRLSESDLSTEHRWVTCQWFFAGAILFGAVMGFTLVVRVFEGRRITEPLFPLLVAINAGGIAGLIAGYNQSRAQAKTEQVETVNEALGFVNQLIRHDLRNDLVVIRGHAGMIEDEQSGTDDEIAESTAVIVEKVDEALTRIKTSQAVAKTLVGDTSLESVDVAALADEMTTRVEGSHEVTVSTELSEGALVTANAGLRSVLDNLLENAVEHNDADDPRIHVGVETTDETVRVAVADNGPGIPDEQKADLFDVHADSSRGGLLLVGRLVEEYGGDVWVEDNDPRGSVFVIELPRANQESQ